MHLIPKLVVFALTILGIDGQSLKAIQVGTLPTVLNSMSIVYDGQDSIYLFGGKRKDIIRHEILRFSISTETIEEVAKLPWYFYDSIAHLDANGDIYCLGGAAGNSDHVYQYSPQVNVNGSEEVAQLPYDVRLSTSVKLTGEEGGVDPRKLIIFGGEFAGDKYKILSFDMATLTSTDVGNLTFSYDKSKAIKVGDKAFLFDGQYSTSNVILVVDLLTFESDRYQVDLPLEYKLDLVYDGTDVYIIGGYHYSTIDPRGIIKFNPETYEWILLPIEDHPLDIYENYYRTPPASVYVESLNRIYFFGGTAYEEHDEIWYVDLNPQVS